MKIKRIIITPFIFIIDFIKHFFIGIKFVFFDSFRYIYESLKKDRKIKSKEPKYLDNKKEYYYYEVKNSQNKIIRDYMLSANKITLRNFLSSEGYEIRKIKKSFLLNILKKIGLEENGKMRSKELMFWITEVSTYLKAGLTLNDTIKIMAEQNKKNRSKYKLYRSILYELTLGENFSTALKNQGRVFPPLLINMIKSAEATGDIISTLDDMASYYTEIDKTHKEMISAIIYPVILLVFALCVMTFIMVYVVPEFIKVYEESGIEVGGFTLTIVRISKYMSANLGTIALFLIIFISTLLLLYKKSKNFRKTIQIIGMRFPFFGKIFIYHEITLFTKTFSSLLKNSVYITNSMEILSSVTNNEVFKSVMMETMENIKKGDKISKSFENKWYIPDIAYHMIVTGEQTGELTLMMGKVANYFNDLHKSRVTNLKSFLEPIMIMLIALIVGVIILAVVVPMFSLYTKIS